MQSCSLPKYTLYIGPVVVSFSFSLFVLRRIQSHILSNHMLDECQSLDECKCIVTTQSSMNTFNLLRQFRHGLILFCLQGAHWTF